jgi:acylglycerol lipase
MLLIAMLLSSAQLAGCAASRSAADTPPNFAASAQFTTADGVTLPLRRHAATAPARAVLLALHGFNDHSGFIDEPARYFARHGIETIAYDQRGFGSASDRGHWGGSSAMADDFLAMLQTVRRDHPGVPLYALGTSMGAAVIAVALARAPHAAVDGAILVTPAVWSRDTMPWYQRFAIDAGASLAPWFTLSSTRFGIVATDNAAVRRDMARDPLVFRETPLARLDGLTQLMGEAQQAIPQMRPRTLLLYGLRDSMMPRQPLIALFERWPPATPTHFRFALYPDGYHMLLRDQQRQVVWDDILAWLLTPETALPSGLERQRGDLLPLLRTRH